VVMKLQAHKFEHRGKFSDYAILYRGNHQARIFEQYLRDHRIPYLLSGGQSFFDKAEIKDITAYLRLLANNDDDPAFIRAATTPKRGIGGATLKRSAPTPASATSRCLPRPSKKASRTACSRASSGRCSSSASSSTASGARGKEPAQQVMPDLLKPPSATKPGSTIRKKSARRKRAGPMSASSRQLAERARARKTARPDRPDAEHRADQPARQAEWRRAADAVQLSTLHAAKGLEYKHVFLVGIEEGMLPHRESIDPAKIEEERR
jgi:ATP-dependent DNA helicase Rep